MSITVKVSDIVTAAPALRKVTGQKMPGPIVFQLSKTMKAIQAELDVYEGTRVKLVEQYGEVDEKGLSQVKAENMEDFVKDVNEVLASEVTLNVDPVSIEKMPDLMLTVEEMNLISFIFV